VASERSERAVPPRFLGCSQRLRDFFLDRKRGHKMRQTDSKTAAHSAVSQPEANTQKQGHDRVLRDDIVPQLGRRIRGGRETWVVHCSRAGKVEKITLGACTTIPIVRARAMALDLLEEAPTHSPLSGKTALAAFAQIFLDDCAGRWKPKTLHSHRHAMSRHILPGLGNMKIGKIERSDVTAWFNKVKDYRLTPVASFRGM
jgi:hypothetical protein